jgi:hypothetical protein
MMGEGNLGNGASGRNKNFVKSDNQDDTKAITGAGMGVAQITPAMTPSKFSHASVPQGEIRAFAPAPATPSANPAGATQESAATVAAGAHRAIETVARLAEIQANRGVTSGDAVSFGVKIGGENLTVRVEMRGGEVRTQFSTDSAELREAIASQWSSLAGGSSDRSYHFSEPVFTTSDGQTTTGGDSGGSRQTESEVQSFAAGFGPAGDELGEADPEPVDFAAAAIPAGSLHLQAFA